MIYFGVGIRGSGAVHNKDDNDDNGKIKSWKEVELGLHPFPRRFVQELDLGVFGTHHKMQKSVSLAHFFDQSEHKATFTLMVFCFAGFGPIFRASHR